MMQLLDGSLVALDLAQSQSDRYTAMRAKGECRYIDYAFVDETLAIHGGVNPQFARSYIGEVNGPSSIILSRCSEMDDTLFRMMMDVMDRQSELSLSSDPGLREEHEKLAQFQYIMLTRPIPYVRPRQPASPITAPTEPGLVGLGLGGTTSPSWSKIGNVGSTTKRLNRISLDGAPSSVPMSRTNNDPLAARRPPPELLASVSASIASVSTPSPPGKSTTQSTTAVNTVKGKTLKAGFLQTPERLLKDSSLSHTVKPSSPKTPQTGPELSGIYNEVILSAGYKNKALPSRTKPTSPSPSKSPFAPRALTGAVQPPLSLTVPTTAEPTSDSSTAKASPSKHDVRAARDESARARALRYRDLTPSFVQPASPIILTRNQVPTPDSITPEQGTAPEGSLGARSSPTQGAAIDLSTDPSTIPLPASPLPLDRQSFDSDQSEGAGITTAFESEAAPTEVSTSQDEETAAATLSSPTQGATNSLSIDATTGLLSSSAFPLDRQSSNIGQPADPETATTDVAKDTATIDDKKVSDGKKAVGRSKENRLQ